MFGAYTGKNIGGRAFDRRKIPLLVGIAAISPLLIISTPFWPETLQRAIQLFGFCMIAISIIGRTWCSSVISGYKTDKLIVVGPYSIVRNPLYVFSIIGAAGVGAQFGAISLAIISATYVAIALIYRILDEEREMLRLHGNSYKDYMAKVPRLLPQIFSWRSASPSITRPSAVLRTFFDACFLLLAFPSAEILQHLQRAGSIHAVVRLP
jgi:protein-S-isoprenylcysteine O-methyltransferase Ste14